jgi:hypothetical protein
MVFYRIARHFKLSRSSDTSTPMISIDGPSSGTRATRQLDAPNVLPVHRVSSRNNCTSYVSCLQLLLTVWAGRRRVTIDILPDDVLLLIFHFHRILHQRLHPSINLEWHQLVHVCQRWRSVVFASPNFLNLRLVCGPWTRVGLTGIWPPLPIIIRDGANDWFVPEHSDLDTAIAVHYNRVREINLFNLISLQLQRLASAMREQFPALIHLTLHFAGYDRRLALDLPDEFLGGSTPRLQSLELQSIPFPALPKLLLSATELVRLTLWKIPHSGYVSPEAIATGLAVLANLESLTLEFMSPLSRPNRATRRPPPPTRGVLPALTRFRFRGASEYLEDLVARIDAPLLDSIYITFFHQLIFDIPRLTQFMRRTTRFQALNEAHVEFTYPVVQVGYLPPIRTFDETSGLRISCRGLDWQLSFLAQVCTSFFPSIYMVEHLYIHEPRYLPSQWQDETENMQWLEMFHPFTAVKNLYVCEGLAPSIAPALQELVGGRRTEVLPILQTIYLEGLEPSEPVQEGIGKFVAARQLSGHPITVSRWEKS